MTAILRLTNLKWAWLALILVALFAFGSYDVVTAQEDGTCSDGIDNNGNGLIDLEDPACTTLSEATPAPTAEPTTAPTAEPTAITTAPATQEPTAAATATPTTLPDTGGNPNQDGTQPPADPQFSEWLAQTGVIGIVVAFVVMLITVFKVTLSSNIKRGICLVIGIGCAIIYVATKDNLAIDSPNDVFLTALSVLASSQIAYLLAVSALPPDPLGMQKE